MTKREMMVKAHMMARKMVGNYSARLSLALRQLWSSIKGAAEIVDIKCNFRGIDCVVNTETGAIVGNLYSVKAKLQQHCWVKWNAINKCWHLVAGGKLTQERMIEIFIENHAVK